MRKCDAWRGEVQTQRETVENGEHWNAWLRTQVLNLHDILPEEQRAEADLCRHPQSGEGKRRRNQWSAQRGQMKTRVWLLETQGRGDEGPPHRCHHTVDERKKSLLLLMKTFGYTRDCFITFVLSCLSYLEWTESQIPKCNHFTIKKQKHQIICISYLELSLEERLTLRSYSAWLIYLRQELKHTIIYILGLCVYIVDTVYWWRFALMEKCMVEIMV